MIIVHRYGNIITTILRPAVFVVDLEVLSQHFMNGSPGSGCGLHASLVEDTKIIQEDTHL